ncbi:MAG TPA: ABC transporter permease subunit [Candidatus Dormibacteraeota bacterium]|nr:ABC transporter permease subunit [Candidatus Dormibacteraeota bacterium]
MIDVTRVRAVARKEFREYSRHRSILATMVVLPLIFLILPVSAVFRIHATAAASAVRAQVGTTLLLLLLTPVILPAALSAYSVIGEREQGTLEPVLTTPVTREELIIGKAAAVLVPTVSAAYLFFAVMVLVTKLAAAQVVVDAVWQLPNFVAQLLFAPLLAGWAIWVGMAISARSSDVRVAQQLSTLASLPALALTALMSYQVITPSVGVAVVIALVLLGINMVAWRVVSAMFDRERLVTGSSAVTEARAP